MLCKALDKNVGEPISVTTIVDIMNMIGKCVVAGNVRRTAEIVFGDPQSEEYINLKNYKKNPHRETYGWTSNNSIFAELGMDYTDVCKRITDNGEPGFAWLENMRGFLITHAIPIAVGYSHKLREEAYLTIKKYAIHRKRLCMESGGINEEYVDWFKEQLKKY